MSNANGKLFEDPHSTYPTELAEQDFSRYIAACNTLIENTRQDLIGNPKAHEIIAANSPAEWNATAMTGALLLHGLYDSPFIMKDLAEHLQTSGLKVRTLLLPGHGTVPGALLNVRYEEWIQTVEMGLKGLAQTCNKIWIVGFSTGGNLALYHAIKQTSASIAGVVLLAPAIKIPALSAITNLPPKLGLEWYHQDRELDYSKYESFTFNSIYQLHLLIKDIQQMSQHELAVPLFMAVSADDKTISSPAAVDYFQRFANAQSQLIIYGNENIATVKHSEMRPAAFPALHIRNLSHVAIPVAMDNPHYGQRGDYAYASRQASAEAKIFGSDNTFFYALKNLLHRCHLYPHRYERLTYNPDFNFLKNAISQFIEKN